MSTYQIKGHEDLVNSDLNIVLASTMKNSYAEKKSSLEAAIYEKSVLQKTSVMQGLIDVALKRDQAVAVLVTRAKYFAPILVNKYNELLFYIIDEIASRPSLPIHAVFERGHPLLPVYNKHLMNMWETGHVEERLKSVTQNYEKSLKLAEADKWTIKWNP